MSTVAQNAALADSLFANLRDSGRRYLDTQGAIAQREAAMRRENELANLRRIQQVQDQQADANLRRELTAEQIKGQQTIEESRAKRDDSKAEAAEKRAQVAAVRAAYARYQEAGGDEPIEKFGPLDAEGTFFAIQKAMGERVSETQRTQFRELANLLRDEGDSLVSSARTTPQELEALRSTALLTLDSTHKDAAKHYNKVAAKSGEQVALNDLAEKFPAAYRSIQMQVTAGARAIEAEKAKSPDFIRNLQAWQQKQSSAMRSALESPYGSEFFNNLRPQREEAPAKAGAPAAPGALDVPAATAAAVPGSTVQSAPEFDVSNLSLAGLYRNRAPIADGAMQVAAAPGRLIDNLGRFGGAMTRGLVTGDYSVPEKGVIERAGEGIGNLLPTGRFWY